MRQFIPYFLIFTLCALPSVGAATRQTHYKLYWRERNGEIVLGSVCDNYGYGSIAYRGCRVQAQRHFEAQCRRYGKREENAQGELRLRYRRKRQRYCRAAALFGPVD